jgi:hypothetical protein
VYFEFKHCDLPVENALFVLFFIEEELVFHASPQDYAVLNAVDLVLVEGKEVSDREGKVL